MLRIAPKRAYRFSHEKKRNLKPYTNYWISNSVHGSGGIIISPCLMAYSEV